ncbi:hypothetical protein HY628_02630 [Candidatus Uhrbacteria bacterium]|nr:hypothetical protein [Candidatus Uhrbacteria bacterium]
MPPSSNSHPRGAVLLTSVLIIGGLLIGLAILASASLVTEFGAQTGLVNKKTAVAAATACTEYAINRLGRLAAYPGNETLAFGAVSCTVRPIQQISNTWVIETEATVAGRTARLETRLSSRAPPVVSSWQEVSTFP